MTNNNEKRFVDTYAKYLQIKAELEVYDKRLSSYNIDIDSLEYLLKEQLEEKEYEVFIKYNSNLNSLKKIAHEQNYSYPYIRKLYVNAKNKIDIIAGVLKHSNQKKINNK